MDELEGESGDDSAKKFGDEEDPDAGPGGETHDGDTDGDAGIERATRDVADGESAGHDGHADGEAVEGISSGTFGGGGVEDDEDEREGEKEFGEECGESLQTPRSDDGAALEEFHDDGGDNGANNLSDPIGGKILGLKLSAQPDAQGNRGIVVPAGNMPAGENHDHEGRADAQGSEPACAWGDDGAANGQDQKKRANRFDQIFSHITLR